MYQHFHEDLGGPKEDSNMMKPWKVVKISYMPITC